MTDPRDPLDTDPPTADDALDTLASAHLDGQTTPAEAARIAADPDLVARVAAMNTVRAALRTADEPPVDDARRSQAIEAALAAFDEGASPGAAGAATPGAPIPIDAMVTRRDITRRRLRLVGAAAAAVLVALAIPALSRLGSDHDGDASTASAPDSPTAQREATADGSDEAATAGGGTSDAMTYAAADLGTFDDLAALTASVRSQLDRDTAAPELAGPTTTTAARTPTAGTTTCPGPPGAVPADAGPPVLVAGAVLEGRAVVVSVYELASGERRLIVADAADCSVITSAGL